MGQDYPDDPQYEEYIREEGYDGVHVYLTKEGDIFLCAPYVIPPCFGPKLADAVCAAIQRAVAASKQVSK